MRACGTACGSDIAYDLALTYPLTYLESFGIAGQMEISCGIYGIVPDADCISTGSFILLAGHHSVTYGHHRSAFRSGIVHTGMRLDPACDRMSARIGES